MGNERVSISLGKPAIRFGRPNCAADKPHAPHRRSRLQAHPAIVVQCGLDVSRAALHLRVVDGLWDLHAVRSWDVGSIAFYFAMAGGDLCERTSRLAADPGKIDLQWS